MPVQIFVAPSLTTIVGIDRLRIRDIYFDAPEPPEGDHVDEGLRSTGANLLYLHEQFPDAHWNDPGNRLVEARTYRYLSRLRTAEPGEYERNFPFKVPPAPHQLRVFTHARHLTNIALAPAALGCVDADTEFLTPTGWKRIADYDGEDVAQYWPATGFIDFVARPEFVKLPCEEMIRFKTTRGVDQLLSPEHRVLLADGSVISAELIERYWSILAYDKVKFRTTFRVSRAGLPLSDDLIRLQIAVNADGYIHRNAEHPNRGNVCHIRVKKDRKKQRLRRLLAAASVTYKERDVAPEGFTTFSFSAPRAKGFDAWWWEASQRQLEIIADEVPHWDGSFRKAEGVSFFTTGKGCADFVQYAMSAAGRRTSCRFQDRRREGRETIDWLVHASSRPPEAGLFGGSMSSGTRSNISREPSPDGYKYCFMVPSTFLLLRRNGCIFATGNTGKTKMALDIAADKFLRDEIDGVAVICLKGLMRQWVHRAVPEHLSDAVQRRSHVWKPTTKVPADVAQQRLDQRYMRIMAFNIEAFQRPDSKAEHALADFLQSGRILWVYDESTRIKNYKAERTKTAIRLRHLAASRMILTGTPVTKGLEDFFTQYQFLDPDIIGLSNYFAFRGRYCVTQRISGRNVDPRAVRITGYRNQEELIRKIAPVSFMIPESVLGLPEKRYERVEVEMTPEQERIYRMLRDQLIEDLAAHRIESPVYAMVRLLRMQQVLCGRYYEMVETEDEMVRAEPRLLPNNRPEVLANILEQHDGQALIWVRFKDDIDAIVERIGGLGRLGVYEGETPQAERDRQVAAFQRGEIDYMILNKATGSTGVDGLQCANLAIYYSNSFNRENRWQSEGRIYRMGQRHSTCFIDLVCPGTVDTRILRAYKETQDLAMMVMNDPSFLSGGLDDELRQSGLNDQRANPAGPAGAEGSRPAIDF